MLRKFLLIVIITGFLRIEVLCKFLLYCNNNKVPED